MLSRVKVPVWCLCALRNSCQHTTWRGLAEGKNGLVLGAWEICGHPNKNKLTIEGDKLDVNLGGKITERFADRPVRRGKIELAHDVDKYYVIALCGLGTENRGLDEAERLHECREDVRRAAAIGVNYLTQQQCTSICVDPMTCADAAAEGTKLANWQFQEFKEPCSRFPDIDMNLFSSEFKDSEAWNKGLVMADAQNTARLLSEFPANVLTPKHFAEEAIRILCPCGVHVNVRNLRWIEDQRMFAFLNIAKGSCEMPYFVEINYCGGAENDRPVVLLGKGVTFDSGGLCLKKCNRAKHYGYGDLPEKRGSCCGAASVVGIIKALARLAVPVNVIGLLPLFENMPGGSAIKPGDVIMALNGRTIVIEDTDNEGRLALADTLVYSDTMKPCLDIVIGNISMGSRMSLGSGATATFSSSQVVWDELDRAGAMTGDRVWRMPLWNEYRRRVTMCPHVDTCNMGRGGPDAGPCLGAAFLSEFVPGCDYLHMDITGTGMMTRGITAPYLRRGFMTGRPTRTVAQFINNMACPLDKPPVCSGV